MTAVATGRSEQGRGILIAVVTGEAGDGIRRWRQREDPAQARRYPPHVTLCYDVPDSVDEAALDRQVRHAFVEPVGVRLGGVRVFDNAGRTAYVEVLDTHDLDVARERLYDGKFMQLPPREPWQWHVTCLRRTEGSGATVERAREELALATTWRIDRIDYRVLRGDAYQLVVTWSVNRVPAAPQDSRK